MAIRRVIFHDVPRTSKIGQAGVLTLSEVETKVDATRKAHLLNKLRTALASKWAHAVQFSAAPYTNVPEEVRLLTTTHQPQNIFVESTQRVANYLFQEHIGSVSPGLLCAIDVIASKKDGLVLMKLEREEGAQLDFGGEAGQKTFSMSVLDNLVLTEGTRLFKAGMFLRIGNGDDAFRATVCDDQLKPQSSVVFSKYWMPSGRRD